MLFMTDRITFSGLCCNCNFPDDDDDDEEGTQMVPGFRASRLQCPPQSCQSTPMGRDCATDSAQCFHLWLFPAELTVWLWLYHNPDKRLIQFELLTLTLTLSH